ncbi:MAG: hypothetical protein ACE5OO_07625, partial [Candidatus Bathyarchaeia archaeon]
MVPVVVREELEVGVVQLPEVVLVGDEPPPARPYRAAVPVEEVRHLVEAPPRHPLHQLEEGRLRVAGGRLKDRRRQCRQRLGEVAVVRAPGRVEPLDRFVALPQPVGKTL